MLISETLRRMNPITLRGEHHVNSIEGYWTRLKNSIKSTHVHVLSKHLRAYVAEFSFRYNMRKEAPRGIVNLTPV